MKRPFEVCATLGWLAAGVGLLLPRPQVVAAAAELRLAPGAGNEGFARALEPRRFVLPEDHGPHFDYQTEWWYYTGNVGARDGRRYGYQLTLFRRGLSPGPPPVGPGLATNQVYFAHLAVTDVADGRHRYAERWSRGAGGLSGASGRPFRAFLEGWTIEALNEEGSEVQLHAREGDLGLDLRLVATKPLVAHGMRGLSPKSDEAGNASFYVSYTRLATQGTLRVAGTEASVVGESWFDHEWSTSALGPDARGWDWFSLQLGDGRELMFFQIRRADGTAEPVSGGTLVRRDGETRRLGLSDVDLAPLALWRSPESGARYPVRWALALPLEGLELIVEARVAAQEMRTAFTYWEGAVAVSGRARGRPVAGHGYLEMTGYATSMQGVF